MIYDELIVYLCVVVGMVVEVTHYSILHLSACCRFIAPNLALGVVSTVALELLGANARIGQIDLCHTTEREELDTCAIFVVTNLKEV